MYSGILHQNITHLKNSVIIVALLLVKKQLLTWSYNISVDQSREVSSDCGEMAAVSQPAVKGTGDYLPPHGAADQSNGSCLLHGLKY